VILPDKGRHTRRVISAGGNVELSRRYFWVRGKTGLYPVDEALGLERDGPITPGAAQMMVRMGIVGDFRQGVADLKQIGGLTVSREKMRQVVEAEGEAARQARAGGAVPASWSEKDALIEDGPGKGKTRIYAGGDGVFVPTVTQAEKDKRRKAQAVRRQQRSAAQVGNQRELPAARPGTLEKSREMKIGVFYDQEKRHRHVFATEKPCEEFGPLLKIFSAQVGFERAAQTIWLSDGAKWIYSQVCAALLTLMAIMLDFYHLSEHVHAAAGECFGPGTEAARAWAKARLEEFKTLGPAAVLAAIEALNKKTRAKRKKESLRQLREYIVSRLDMLEYRGALANGWDIGSGPTEAMCKNLTLRLKRPGMKWDAEHAGAMMNLIALYESGQATAYYRYRATRKAA
jgi:hypothetical protein